jgi:hypothetical protein
MIPTEEAVAYLKLQHLRAPDGTERKIRIWIPWIPARDSNTETSYCTDQTDAAVKLCICTWDVQISTQKGDLGGAFLFSPFRQTNGGFLSWRSLRYCDLLWSLPYPPVTTHFCVSWISRSWVEVASTNKLLTKYIIVNESIRAQWQTKWAHSPSFNIRKLDLPPNFMYGYRIAFRKNKDYFFLLQVPNDLCNGSASLLWEA